jgi:quinol monooxygenase YgiN
MTCMLIVAGHLSVAPEDRDHYLGAVAHVAVAARMAPGCLDFVQGADSIDTGRINVYERWRSDDDLERFRASGEDPPVRVPPLIHAELAKYRISAVEAP